jgi:hypothetical protein
VGGNAVNAFIIAAPNKPGELARIAEAIAQKGINITSLASIGWQGQGGIALTTNDESGTRSALSGIGDVQEIEIIAVSLEDRPGTLAEASRKLADAGINIELVLPIGMREGKVSVAFATSDNVRAKELIGLGALATA